MRKLVLLFNDWFLFLFLGAVTLFVTFPFFPPELQKLVARGACILLLFWILHSIVHYTPATQKALRRYLSRQRCIRTFTKLSNWVKLYGYKGYRDPGCRRLYADFTHVLTRHLSDWPEENGRKDITSYRKYAQDIKTMTAIRD